MRIDKFLWAVRIFKTRNIAAEACKKNLVKVNGEPSKSSKLVYIGDTILVRKNQINYEYEILQVPESRIGAKLVDVHLKETTDTSQFEKLELLKYSQDYYRKKGSGRPTKKDRRDIDDYNQDND